MADAPLPKQSGSARSGGKARRNGSRVRVLTVGTDDWAIEQAAAALELAGHVVLRCHSPNEPPFPCNAFRPDRGCPLDVGVDVVVTSRARPTDQPTAAETGVVCGLHAGLPLIVTGISRNSPYAGLAGLAVAEGGDLVEAVEQVAAASKAAAAEAAKSRPTVVALPEAVDR